MKVAITGGTGLIGRALVEELLAAGHEATVTSRNPDSVEGLPDGVAVRSWDTSSAQQLAPILGAVDAVVHLTGENIGGGRWTEDRKRRIRDSRVRSTEALTTAYELCDHKPGILVQGSAVGYYGPRGDEPIPETTPPGSDFLAGVCQAWEQASAGVEEHGVRRAIARTGVVLAEDGGALPRILLPFKLFAGGPVGSGRQVLPWIHLRDEARAMVRLVEDSNARGAFNLAAPGAVTNRELAREIGRVLGRPSFVPTPAVALKIALGEMATLVLDGQRAVPSRLLELGYQFEFPELGAALEDLLS